MLTSPSTAACSRTVTSWPARAMPIAAARPPRPAPTIPTWILGLLDMRHRESCQVCLDVRIHEHEHEELMPLMHGTSKVGRYTVHDDFMGDRGSVPEECGLSPSPSKWAVCCSKALAFGKHRETWGANPAKRQLRAAWPAKTSHNFRSQPWRHRWRTLRCYLW